MSDTRRLPQARLRSAWRDCCADYLRIVWKLPRIHFLAEGFKGVGEVAKCGYGQFSEDPRTIPLARFSFPPAPSLLGSESYANRLLIAGKLARKIRWDKPVSDTGRLPRARLGAAWAIAAPIICELPGNCARIYFLAEGLKRRRRRALLRSRTIPSIAWREVPGRF